MSKLKPLGRNRSTQIQGWEPDSSSRFEFTPTHAKRCIRVLVADDHPVVRKGVISLLSQYPQLEVLAEAKDGREALEKARSLLPDVVLMDIDMPHLDGLSVTELLRKELPWVSVILLSGLVVTRMLPRILKSGARGFLSKQSSAEEFLAAIEKVTAGDCAFSPEVAGLALGQLVYPASRAMNNTNLTAREREVVILIAEGLSNKEIAAHLQIGTRTVETHRERAMRKLNVHSIAGITTFAVANGLVPLRVT
jgi:DNA-binding NarL/FixJ family response regulator